MANIRAMTRVRWFGTAPGWFALLLLAWAGTALADSSEAKLAQVGHEYYVRYCASCHGVNGLGDGPLAEELKTPSTNLTLIAKSRDGVFPEPLMAEIIDGRRYIRAHGPGNMPVWGRRLGIEIGGHEQHDIQIRGTILLIIEYLKSIQVR